jgi:hypothetical protein
MAMPGIRNPVRASMRKLSFVSALGSAFFSFKYSAPNPWGLKKPDCPHNLLVSL